jgi:hypothetical protein
MLDKGFWADVAVAGEHLRLFSEYSAQGIQFLIGNGGAHRSTLNAHTVESILDRLAVKHYVEQRTVNVQAAVILDKTKLAKFVH